MIQHTTERHVSDAATARPTEPTGAERSWGDPNREPRERVEYALEHMTIEERISRLVGLWVGADSSGPGVAPQQHDMSQDPPAWEDVIAGGLGQLTRPFGPRLVESGAGARSLAASQAQIVAANRWGMPALAHEEYLSGFAAWQATNYPVPLAWGDLLDDGWSPGPPTAPDAVDLDAERGRGLALRLAQESVVVLENSGIPRPLSGTGSIAVVGPRADGPMAMLGCYSFPAHVGVNHPDKGLGVEMPSLLDAFREEPPDREIRYALGCDVLDPDRAGIEVAVGAARAAEVCVVAVGDRAGLVGRGTSGEGCDVQDLRLPGVEEDLVHALIATGTPVVVVLLTGRPSALGAIVGEGGREGASALVQAFFPSQLGVTTLARVVSGAVNPSGPIPVSVPREPGSQPGTYLSAPLGRRIEVSNLDPTPLFGFGHGLTYSSFALSEAAVRGESHWRTDGRVRVGLSVTNTSSRPGTEVVQLYLHDPVAQVTRPVVRLIGYARLLLGPGSRPMSSSRWRRTSRTSRGARVGGSWSRALSSFGSGPRVWTFEASSHRSWRVRSVSCITRGC